MLKSPLKIKCYRVVSNSLMMIFLSRKVSCLFFSEEKKTVSLSKTGSHAVSFNKQAQSLLFSTLLGPGVLALLSWPASFVACSSRGGRRTDL